MKHLAPILKAAKDHLEYGHEIHYNVNASIYICRAIEKATIAETVDAAYDAIALIGSRLGRYPTAKAWKWPNSCTAPFTEVQAFRHAWLDALILECETGIRDPSFPAEDLEMTSEKTVEQLRSEGYAVVIFTPDEIKDANASNLEYILVERGNIFLDSAKGTP